MPVLISNQIINYLQVLITIDDDKTTNNNNVVVGTAYPIYYY